MLSHDDMHTMENSEERQCEIKLSCWRLQNNITVGLNSDLLVVRKVCFPYLFDMWLYARIIANSWEHATNSLLC